ncbi:hypothetical protein LBMAG42_53920 [Deltaproteobacteria bacterium]|nr:hypothetical protein LBMAG42_53920 [Deltaproteobacteria bacterium]
MRRARLRSAFTLVELAFVMAILAVLVAAAVPSYQSVLRHAQVAEAYTMVQGIAHAEKRIFRDQGRFLPCGEPGQPPARTAPFSDDPCWRELGFSVSGDVRYHYWVESAGDEFRVFAVGDLDHDGKLSRLELSGLTLAVRVEDELE